MIEKSEDQNRMFAYIKSFRGKEEKLYLELDTAEFFSDEISETMPTSTAIAADMAMYEDGLCDLGLAQIGACTGSGFYIRNNSSSTQEFQVSSFALVRVMHESPVRRYVYPDGTWKETIVSLKKFISIIESFLLMSEGRDDSFIYPRLPPYWLTIKDGQIVEIQEQYIP